MSNDIVAIVLAGGYATRFWPITKNRPKVLLPIDGEMAVMDKQIFEATEDDRISDVYVSTNAKFENQIREHIEQAEYETPKVSVEETQSEEQKLGVVGALRQFVNREPVEDKDLLIVAGDNIMDMHLEDLVNQFQEEKSTYVVTYDIEDKEKATSYGVVNVDEDGHILDFEEKPDNPSSSLVSTACYMIPNEDVRFGEYLKGDNNPDEPGRYMKWLKNQSDMRTYSFQGEWYDIGTPEGYISAVDWWMNGDKFVASSRDTSGTEIGPSSLVFGDGSLKDSKVERSVILPESDIESTDIKSSVVDSGVSVTNVSVEDGIIGNKNN